MPPCYIQEFRIRGPTFLYEALQAARQYEKGWKTKTWLALNQKERNRWRWESSSKGVAGQSIYMCMSCIQCWARRLESEKGWKPEEVANGHGQSNSHGRKRVREGREETEGGKGLGQKHEGADGQTLRKSTHGCGKQVLRAQGRLCVEKTRTVTGKRNSDKSISSCGNRSKEQYHRETLPHQYLGLNSACQYFSAVHK